MYVFQRSLQKEIFCLGVRGVAPLDNPLKSGLTCIAMVSHDAGELEQRWTMRGNAP